VDAVDTEVAKDWDALDDADGGKNAG